jgi:hypothetical protein
MKHRGLKPAGQPRSLRSVAEEKSGTAGFEDAVEFDAQAGVPKGASGGSYNDEAETVLPAPSTGRRAPGPQDQKPFK